MKTILFTLLLSAIAAAAAPDISTNKWAGQYHGVLLSTSRSNPERVTIDVYIWPDNYAEAHVYSYTGEELEVATGTHAKGKVTIVFPTAQVILKGTASGSRLRGTVKQVVKGAGPNYTLSCPRRWEYGYNALYDLE